MVAGTDRFDTDLMQAYGGRIVAKGGAEGVHCFGDKETGIGVALKITDGNGRGTNVASMEVLKQLGIGDPSVWNDLKDYHDAPVLNARDEKIGEIKPAFCLAKVRAYPGEYVN
jgi:L-asparaginase II